MVPGWSIERFRVYAARSRWRRLALWQAVWSLYQVLPVHGSGLASAFRCSSVRQPFITRLRLTIRLRPTIRRRATIRRLQPITARHRGLTRHRRGSTRRLISPARPERRFARWSTPLHTALPATAPRPRAGCGVAQHDGRSSRGRLARGSAGQSSRSAARRQTEPYGAN
jgi:hypothetical protein